MVQWRYGFAMGLRGLRVSDYGFAMHQVLSGLTYSTGAEDSVAGAGAAGAVDSVDPAAGGAITSATWETSALS